MKQVFCWCWLGLVLGLLLVGCGQGLPDGTRIVARYDDQAYPVEGIAWSSDGRRIAAALLNGPVAIVDAGNGKEVARYTGHTQQMGVVAWSPDGKYVASGGLDKQAQVWDAHRFRRL